MPGGRPAIYKTEYAEIARDCCAAGATNETLAERFAVSRRTVNRTFWLPNRLAEQAGRGATGSANYNCDNSCGAPCGAPHG